MYISSPVRPLFRGFTVLLQSVRLLATDYILTINDSTLYIVYLDSEIVTVTMYGCNYTTHKLYRLYMTKTYIVTSQVDESGGGVFSMGHKRQDKAKCTDK